MYSFKYNTKMYYSHILYLSSKKILNLSNLTKLMLFSMHIKGSVSTKQNVENMQVQTLPWDLVLQFNNWNHSHKPLRCTAVTGAVLSGLTVVRVLQDVDLGGVVVHSQAAADRHRQRDVEGLLPLVQGVVDDHHATQFLPLASVKAQDAAVILRPGDVVRVGQHGGGDRPRGRTCGERTEKRGQGQEGQAQLREKYESLKESSTRIFSHFPLQCEKFDDIFESIDINIPNIHRCIEVW